MIKKQNINDLTVIMPVYNEEGGIIDVVEKWQCELEKLKIIYNICVYNDGSKDKTKELLEHNFSGNSKIKVINKTNSGHGPTILMGYRNNSKSKWLFQIDSDDEMSPEYFEKLWLKRMNFDFLIGERIERNQQLSRKIISLISRITVLLFYGSGVKDVNSPYRLMRSSVFCNYFDNIPKKTFAPNVIISGIVNRKLIRFYKISVPYKFRQTGEVSIKKWKLFKVSLKSFLQTLKFAFNKSNFEINEYNK